MGGQNGEAKLLVLAALLMADELHDLKAVSTASSGRQANGDAKAGRALSAADTERLAKLASRAETIATELERH
jgi:cell division protein ZapA